MASVAALQRKELRERDVRPETQKAISFENIRKSVGLFLTQEAKIGLDMATLNYGYAITETRAAQIAESRRGPTFEPKRVVNPDMMEVAELVCLESGVSLEEMRGRRNSGQVVRARQVAMHLIRKHCKGTTWQGIGVFLEKDHTTVVHGDKATAAKMMTDPITYSLVERVEVWL